MTSESSFQKKIATWLRQKGCYVLTTTVNAGIPVGCPDIIALIPGGGWLALEVKKDAKSRFQPLQKETIAKLDGMYYSKAVYPENWDEIKLELEQIV